MRTGPGRQPNSRTAQTHATSLGPDLAKEHPPPPGSTGGKRLSSGTAYLGYTTLGEWAWGDCNGSRMCIVTAEGGEG